MAVATQGLWTLINTMEESARDADGPADRHRKLGVGFVRFGLANPGLFRLIGNREVVGSSPSRDLTQATIAAAQLLGTAVSDLLATHTGDFIDPRLAAVTGWSMVHGITTLLINQQLIPEILGATSGEEVAEQVTGLFTAMLS